ncbi:MAG: PD-(D/E)XK nuclease family transposase [Lachnospiraceae bacterium]|nr:PD-(D/E)XK nuclease family transposase [Lachnospiraceae bacterium]
MRAKNTKLSEYFPMIKAREMILKEIKESIRLNERFKGFKKEEQEYFLDICTGAKGIKILYDSFFKEIMSPESTPNRISSLLSVLIGKEVTVVEALPTESRIADEESLLIMDILVKMKDGTLANIEAQKIGYKFAGERASCYSADLLLRQYKRIREQSSKKTFNYKDVKEVYTIIFFENSPAVLKNYHDSVNSDIFIHKFEQKSDTGVELNLLQKFIFISLDIFKIIYQNKSINTKSAAWLTFLSTDEPDVIEELITNYPEFKPLYEDIYNMCNNVEKVMEMFSNELREMDRNTVHLMIDEYQEEVEKKLAEIKRQNSEIERQNSEIERQNSEIERQNSEINTLKEENRKQKTELQNLKTANETQIKEIMAANEVKIDSLIKEIENLKSVIQKIRTSNLKQ